MTATAVGIIHSYDDCYQKLQFRPVTVKRDFYSFHGTTHDAVTLVRYGLRQYILCVSQFWFLVGPVCQWWTTSLETQVRISPLI